MLSLVTTLGNLTMEQAGIILPHEHVFVDLRTPDQKGYAQADTADVIRLMGPYLQEAKSKGIGVIVDCGPIGVGRRPDILKAVSSAVDYPLVVPTGVYREPWIPKWVREAQEEDLEAWMLSELTVGMEDTGVKAGFVKLSAGDDGITQQEKKVLVAAAKAAKKAAAVIGSHTICGRVVRDQLDIMEKAGYGPENFIWIHTQAEPDFHLHLEMAQRGVWIEYDGIGAGPDEKYIELIQRMLDAGYENRLLISQDRGWYDPAQPMGGQPKSYTYLTEVFLSKLANAGVGADVVQLLTRANPFRAFARDV